MKYKQYRPGFWTRIVVSISYDDNHCSTNASYVYIGDERVYTGISTDNWKQRIHNHWYSFTNPRLRNQTAPSKYFWGLKEIWLTAQIKKKIIRKFLTANSFSSSCNLCLEEKISIINYKETRRLLNKRNELIFKYRHKNRFKLTW